MPWARRCAARDTPGHPRLVPTCRTVCNTRVNRCKAWGVRWSCVTCDADYGDNPNFLEGLEKRRERYVVAVRCDFAVRLSRRGGEAQRADTVIGAQPPRSWRTVAWWEGSQGWIRGLFAALRAWRVTSSGRRKAGWLIGEQTADGQLKYYWSNFGSRVPLDRLVESCAPAALGGAVSSRGQGTLGLGSVSGAIVAGFSSPCGDRDAGVQFPGVARVATTPAANPAGPTASGSVPATGSAAGVTAGSPPTDLRLAPPPSGQGVAVA